MVIKNKIKPMLLLLIIANRKNLNLFLFFFFTDCFYIKTPVSSYINNKVFFLNYIKTRLRENFLLLIFFVLV